MARSGKRKGTARSQHRSPDKRKHQRKNPFFWIGGAILVAIIVFAFWGRIPFTSTEGKKSKSFSVQGGETRPVLDPSLFAGKPRAAYAAAKQYPEVLDQVFCYCTCDEPPFNHKSLLSCFVDNHGAG